MEDGRCLVYLAVYNGEAFIEETLESILHQDYPNFAIVLTDDGSTDASRTILRRYQAQYPNIICYRENQVNMGIGRTLFSAYRRCHEADYFAGIGHDDIWAPDYLSKQIEYLKEHDDCVASFARYRYIDRNGKSINKSLFANEILNSLTQEELFLQLLQGNFLFAASGVVDLNRVGQETFGTFFGFDSDRLQDFEMWLNLSLRGQLCYNPSTNAAYRVRPGSMGDGSRHVLQERYEFYSAIRRALFSAPFDRFLERSRDPSSFLDHVFSVLEQRADKSELFSLLLMDFAQAMLNTGRGTEKAEKLLRSLYFKSGLLTKSLHGVKNLPQPLAIVCSPNSKSIIGKLLFNSGCFCLLPSGRAADFYAFTPEEISENIAAGNRSLIIVSPVSETAHWRNSFPYAFVVEVTCDSETFKENLLLWAEDHAALFCSSVSTRLVQQELERLRQSGAYRCGQLIYSLTERLGILKVMKKHLRKRRIKL